MRKGWMILVSASLLLAGTSCVSKKKYLEAENERIEAEKEAKNLRERLISRRPRQGYRSLAPRHSQLQDNAQHQHG
jgi:hypothetical protein